MNKRILLYLFILGFTASGNAQTYAGTEFWFGVLENLFPSKSIQMMVVAEKTSTIQYEVPAQGFSTSYTVSAGSSIITLDKSVIYPTAGAGNVDNKGAHLTSDNAIQVFILNEDAFSSDATPIIPFNRFLKGEKYIIQSLPGSTFDGSSFLIVSTAENTAFDITPSVKTVSGFNAFSTFSVTLDKGESFLVKADNDGDLSGSTIVSKQGCDKFVVFTGSKCSQSEYNSTTCTGCDHLYSHLIPVSHYGTEFYAAPFATQPGNYVIKVTASQDNTVVSIDGVAQLPVLNTNESWEYRPFAPTSKKTCIKTSKPSLVYQYLNSKGCNLNTNGKGDPSMLLLPSIDKWTRESKFGVFNTGNVNTHFINIVASKAALSNIQISGDVPFTKFYDTTLLCNEIGLLTITTSQGFFSIKSDSLFYAYVYSTGDNESFAYLTGALVYPFKGDYNLSAQQVCFNAQPISLGIGSDSLEITGWNMGDGFTYGNVSSVSHTYAQSGEYLAQVEIKLKSNTCSSDSVQIPITILPEVKFDGIKDSTVCPGEKLIYQLAASQKLKYTWQDNVVGSTREISNTGTYVITATDTNGCNTADSFIINDSGCFDKNIVLYNTITPNNDGLNDVWELSSQGYSSISFVIYNRYGTEVFSGDALKQEWWDGKLKNTEIDCAEGTYFYAIKATVRRTGEVEEVKGVITLIR